MNKRTIPSRHLVGLPATLTRNPKKTTLYRINLVNRMSLRWYRSRPNSKKFKKTKFLNIIDLIMFNNSFIFQIL